MRARSRALILAGVLALAGCATAQHSWVSPVAEQIADPVAGAIAEWLAEAVPPARSTLLVVPVARQQQGNKVTAALMDALRRKGFGLATSREASPSAHVVRYAVTPIFDRHLVIRVQLDDAEAARLFYRDARGGLRPAAALTIREAP